MVDTHTSVEGPIAKKQLSRSDDEISFSRASVGGKGAALIELAEWGLPVPDFICISHEEFVRVLDANGMSDIVSWLNKPSIDLPTSEEEIKQNIQSCVIDDMLIKRISGFINRYPLATFAVRSSGSLEDGADASFAGLYQTVLNVSGIDAITDAIRHCWAALFTPLVLQYLDKRNINQPMGLGLVIQFLVPAQKSGVLFTVDPVTGNDKEMLVEACFGLGEALVSGHVNPDQYRFNWFDNSETARHIAYKENACVPNSKENFTQAVTLDKSEGEKAVLSTAEVRQLVELGCRVQAKSGYPVDIEWAIEKGHIYVLQSRPITQLGFSGITGEWTTADFRDGGVSSSVCTPFMASLYKFVMDFSMADYLQRLGLPKNKEKDVWLRVFFSRPYWNLSASKSYLSKIPDFNERAFDEGLGINPKYEGQGIVSKFTPKSLFYGLKALWVIKRNCRNKIRSCPLFKEKQLKKLSQLENQELDLLSDHELYQLWMKFIEKDYFENESAYFDFIYDNSNLNTFFKDQVSKLNFDPMEFSYLIGGLEGVSHLAQIESLWLIRDKVIQSQDALSYWLNNNIETILDDYRSGRLHFFMEDFRLHILHHGHHSKKELDLSEPRYREIPEYLIKQLRDVLQQDEKNDPRVRSTSQLNRAEEAEKKLLSVAPFWKKKSLRRKLKQVRKFLWWREEMRDLSTKFYYHVRHLTLELAQRLVNQGVLSCKEDIFFLEKNQIIDVLTSNMSKEQCRYSVATNRLYYDSFKHYVIPDEVGERYSTEDLKGDKDDYINGQNASESSNTKSGVSGSPGVVSGIARVITDISDSDRLLPGDILVTRCTDPGWTPKFALLAGVVTETGGILSHAAVICREYGIPAVLAVKGATSQIRDGDTIMLDGNAGTVRLTHE